MIKNHFIKNWCEKVNLLREQFFLKMIKNHFRKNWCEKENF
jgi:hypothetical protein